MCFAPTAALGGFCAEGWATGEETYGLSEWRSRRKLWSQYNIATDRKFRECNIFRCEIYEKWCFGTYQTDPECFLGAILAQDRPEHRFVMIFCRFGVPLGRSKMLQKSIPKSRHFQASLETLFFTIGDPKSAKTRFQNYPKMEPFLECDKTTESCSRFHADLVFEVWRAPTSHFLEPFS